VAPQAIDYQDRRDTSLEAHLWVSQPSENHETDSWNTAGFR
jgi:hypothetical protein